MNKAVYGLWVGVGCIALYLILWLISALRGSPPDQIPLLFLLGIVFGVLGAVIFVISLLVLLIKRK